MYVLKWFMYAIWSILFVIVCFAAQIVGSKLPNDWSSALFYLLLLLSLWQAVKFLLKLKRHKEYERLIAQTPLRPIAEIKSGDWMHIQGQIKALSDDLILTAPLSGQPCLMYRVSSTYIFHGSENELASESKLIDELIIYDDSGECLLKAESLDESELKQTFSKTFRAKFGDGLGQEQKDFLSKNNVDPNTYNYFSVWSFTEEVLPVKSVVNVFGMCADHLEIKAKDDLKPKRPSNKQLSQKSEMSGFELKPKEQEDLFKNKEKSSWQDQDDSKYNKPNHLVIAHNDVPIITSFDPLKHKFRSTDAIILIITGLVIVGSVVGLFAYFIWSKG